MEPASQSGEPAATVTPTSQASKGSGLYGQGGSSQTQPARPDDLRSVRRELHELRADMELHRIEAHNRPLPNVVGWLQAQWQIVPAPVKGIILTYLTLFLVGTLLDLLRKLRTGKPKPGGLAWPTI